MNVYTLRCPNLLTITYSWSHTDPCFSKFAFNLTAGREQLETRTAKDKVPIPKYGGANFVDVHLKVVIVNAAATMFAFQPEHEHGTTVTGGTTNRNYTFAFSRRIGEAFAELEKKKRDVFGDCDWGAGKGNLDDEHYDWTAEEHEDDE